MHIRKCYFQMEGFDVSIFNERFFFHLRAKQCLLLHFVINTCY